MDRAYQTQGIFETSAPALAGRNSDLEFRAGPVPQNQKKMEKSLDDAMKAIQPHLGPEPIDGVILPELALTPEGYALASQGCTRITKRSRCAK